MGDQQKIHALLDRLTLESLLLMEQHIRTKIALERCMVEGESHLAKARYIMGHTQISQLQLPTAEHRDFLAITTLLPDEDDAHGDVVRARRFDLDCKKPTSAQDPLKWFGVLVPQSLHLAQDRFKRSLQWAVRAANVQTQLVDCLSVIAKLNNKLARNSYELFLLC